MSTTDITTPLALKEVTYIGRRCMEMLGIILASSPWYYSRLLGIRRPRGQASPTAAATPSSSAAPTCCRTCVPWEPFRAPFALLRKLSPKLRRWFSRPAVQMESIPPQLYAFPRKFMFGTRRIRRKVAFWGEGRGRRSTVMYRILQGGGK